ncbi:MAG: PilN domain-containing protein [Candidatus Omnitrophota bacterium]|nr:PilN domain-containing protein [Candidatus Omnitrophota bacterium]
MIDINLLPEKFRKKRRVIEREVLVFPKEIIVGLIGGLICLLIITHLILLTFLFSKKMQLSHLTKDWEKILPAKKEIDVFKNEIDSIESRMKSIALIRSGKKISWSQELNKISDCMVRGLWLTRIYFGEGLLKIEGSGVSQKGQELINVGKFTSNLKEDKRFYEGLISLELTNIVRRNIKSTEVVDFIITASIKE